MTNFFGGVSMYAILAWGTVAKVLQDFALYFAHVEKIMQKIIMNIVI